MTPTADHEQATRQVGLAQLSLLETAPADLVLLAAEAGFDFIGARVRPVTQAERPYDLAPGSPLLARTLANVRSTGVRVVDIEFLLMDGRDDPGPGGIHGQRDAWLRMFEAGHALGARTMTVAGADPERARFAENLARMAEDGRAFGIVPTLEPISYQRIDSLPTAAEAARAAGAKVVVDTLHFRRFGGTLEELAAIADLVPMLQLCDAPARRPGDREGLVHESRAGRLAPGEGGLGLAEIVAALPATLPVSVEAPSPRAVERLGALGWARHLRRAADTVLAEARLLAEGRRPHPAPAAPNGAPA